MVMDFEVKNSSLRSLHYKQKGSEGKGEKGRERCRHPPAPSRKQDKQFNNWCPSDQNIVASVYLTVVEVVAGVRVNFCVLIRRDEWLRRRHEIQSENAAPHVEQRQRRLRRLMTGKQ